jgi:hypothetical protein
VLSSGLLEQSNEQVVAQEIEQTFSAQCYILMAANHKNM